MDHRLLSYLYCFNIERDYFECHEYGESLWLDSGRPQILKGLIQAAVCIYHLEGGNVRGGFRMWTRARRYLEEYLHRNRTYEGICIDRLISDMDRMWSLVPSEWRNQTVTTGSVEDLDLPRVTVLFDDERLLQTVRQWTPLPIDQE